MFNVHQLLLYSVFCFLKTNEIKMNILLALTCIVYQGAIVAFISLINLAVSL